MLQNGNLTVISLLLLWFEDQLFEYQLNYLIRYFNWSIFRDGLKQNCSCIVEYKVALVIKHIIFKRWISVIEYQMNQFKCRFLNRKKNNMYLINQAKKMTYSSGNPMHVAQFHSCCINWQLLFQFAPMVGALLSTPSVVKFNK